MPDVEIAPATPADAREISDLCNAITQELYGEGDVDEREVESWFRIPNIGLFVARRNGTIVGYADVRADDDGARFPADPRVHLAEDAAVADVLLAAVEDWARARAKPGAAVRAYTPDRNTMLAEVLDRRGYELVRHSFFMEVDLPEVLEEPRWPDGISIRTYDHDRDETRVYEAHQEAFSDHWDFHRATLDEWRQFQLDRPTYDPQLWWLAEDGDELAGVSLNAWHFSGDPTLGWIGDLAVRRPWRRRGLALALLLHSFADFKRRGATRVGLGVDAENTTGAVRLYERAGMRPVRRNDSYWKTL